MNKTNISFLFSTIKEKYILERNKKITEYENEFNLLKYQISKCDDPYNLVIKTQTMNPLIIKNKIKLFNRAIAICETILLKINMYLDIVNNKTNINDEFIINLETLKLIYKIHSVDEYKNFFNNFILKNNLLKKHFISKIKINEEIISIINYKMPNEEEIEEIIETSLRILGGDHLKKLQLKNKKNVTNFKKKHNTDHNIQYNFQKENNDSNSIYKLNTKINYHDSKVKLHIEKIINKLKEN